MNELTNITTDTTTRTRSSRRRLAIVMLSAIGAMAAATSATVAFPAVAAAEVPVSLRALVVSGDHQSTIVDGAFAQPLVVRVVNISGQPQAGTGVTFSFTSGPIGPEGAGTASFPTGATATVTTDAAGVATSPVLTGRTQGLVYLQVGALGVIPASFVEEVKPGGLTTPGRTVAVSGDRQFAAVNGAFPKPLVVQVVDKSGQPVGGAAVTFGFTTAPPGSGVAGTASFPTAASPIVITDAAGIAASPVLTGRTPGLVYLLASTGNATSASFVEEVLLKPADLQVSVVTPATTVVGVDVGFVATITVKNIGPNASSTVTTKLDMPLDLRIVQSGGAQVSTGRLTWTTPALQPGQSVTVKATLAATSSVFTAGDNTTRTLTTSTSSSVRELSMDNNTASNIVQLAAKATK